MIMIFTSSKLSKYTWNCASSCSNNEYEYKPSPWTLSPDMACIVLPRVGYREGRDACPDYIILYMYNSGRSFHVNELYMAWA